MVKLMALYKRPQDPERFERIYFGEHLPLARKMPGLRRLQIDRITGAPRGEPDLYLVAHLYFDDAETMQRSMASEESRAAARVLRDLGAEVSMVLADTDHETCPHCGARDLPQGFAYCGHCGNKIGDQSLVKGS